MFVGAKAGDAALGLFRGLDDDQEASLERVALVTLAAGKRRTAGDVRPQAARNAVPTQALGGPGIGAFEVPAFVPHALGDKQVIAWRSAREQGKPSFQSSSGEESSAQVNQRTWEIQRNEKQQPLARAQRERKTDEVTDNSVDSHRGRRGGHQEAHVHPVCRATRRVDIATGELTTARCTPVSRV
jgi:hypothetical protein